ncbi:MAG: hypothetical protein ABH881_02315 [bacterium]
MENFKTQIMEKVAVKDLTNFLTLSLAAVFLPYYIHSQWITGPIVNAILILLLFLVGARSALLVCLIPSIMALSSGLLPAILAPAVPFIMMGNVILVLTVEFVYNYFKSASWRTTLGFATGVIAGAGLKFLFLFYSVNVISGLLIKQELAVKVAQMMSWPQFATACIGGVIAWVMLRGLKKV